MKSYNDQLAYEQTAQAVDAVVYVEAHCDCCPNSNSGTRESLERDGWELFESAQFCPMCAGV